MDTNLSQKTNISVLQSTVKSKKMSNTSVMSNSVGGIVINLMCLES